jgi:Mlc titration factor MtfA (ptsG expression regulator)
LKTSPLELIYDFFCGIYEEIRFRLWYGPVFHRFLNRKYIFYTNLPSPLKLRFLRLVRDHYEYFEFVSRNMNLTRAMKAIICSGASQLVLFLPRESLTFFETIIVYPGDYESVITHRHHRGEVNPRVRAIVFSWKGIADGIQRPDDGLNLLLHEFAHALWLEHKITRNRYTVLDDELVSRFETMADAETKKMQLAEKHFFRAYAMSNIEEFFAVAVENFFERAQGFKEQLPEMYELLTQLLRQDPIKLNVKNSPLRVSDHFKFNR